MGGPYVGLSLGNLFEVKASQNLLSAVPLESMRDSSMNLRCQVAELGVLVITAMLVDLESLQPLVQGIQSVGSVNMMGLGFRSQIVNTCDDALS